MQQTHFSIPPQLPDKHALTGAQSILSDSKYKYGSLKFMHKLTAQAPTLKLKLGDALTRGGGGQKKWFVQHNLHTKKYTLIAELICRHVATVC